MTVKELRQKRGMTLRRLSEASGVGLSTIGNYENGKTTISQESLKRIASVFDVSPESLRDPVSVIYEVLNGKKQKGGFKMEEQIIDEVRVRIQQFALANAETRGCLIEQISTRLNEYAAWCGGHYQELHEALVAHAREQGGSPEQR